jgi:hypothetical protein
MQDRVIQNYTLSHKAKVADVVKLIRELAQAMEDLPASGVDADAIDAVHDQADAMRRFAGLLERSTGQPQMVHNIIRGIFGDLKGVLQEQAADVREVRRRIEDAAAKVRKTRALLSARYDREFPTFDAPRDERPTQASNPRGNFLVFSRLMQPPAEVHLEQLNSEIDNINKDIKKIIIRLAGTEAEVSLFEIQLDAKRERQAHLRSDISEMQKSLEGARTEKVDYQGRKVDSSRLADRLDFAVTEYTSLKEQVKAQEQLLAEKKRTLDTAKDRITKMKNEQERLRLVATRLTTHLELAKMKPNQNQEIAFDDSAMSNARQVAKDVEDRLRTVEEEMKLRSQYGYAEKAPLEKKRKSREEVLKSAQEALEDK